MMLFEDEVENFADVEKYPICKAVPLKTHFSLQDIWIPAELLINRKKDINSNRNRPNIFHTLSKPDVKSFSVYYEDSKVSAGNGNLHTFQLSNSCKKVLISSSNTDEINSPKLCFSNEVDAINKSISENPEQKVKLFLELLNMGSSLHEDKAECNDKEKSEDLMDPISMQKQKKFENHRYCEQALDTLNSKTPITVEDKMECHGKGKFEEFLCTLNRQQSLLNDKTFDTVCHNEEKSENVLESVSKKKQDEDENLKIQKDCLGTLNSETPLYEVFHDNEEACNLLDEVCHDNKEACNLLDEVHDASLTDSSSKAVVEYAFALKKHSLQDPPVRQKNQRERKKKNAANKNLQLGDFLQTANSDGYEIPKRDEFYENLVRQGKCLPLDSFYYTNAPERENYGSVTDKQFLGDLPKVHSSTPSNAGTVFEPNHKVQLNEDDENITTLILENITIQICKESIEDLMSNYGILKNVSLETIGKSRKAYVKLVLEHDVKWVVECLHGSEPFGALCGVIKCYQLQG